MGKATNHEIPKMLVVLIEPAGYMVALVDELQKQFPGEVETRFVSQGMTQPWASVEGSSNQILSEFTAVSIGQVASQIWQQNPDVVLVAGWRHPVVVSAIVFAKLRGCFVMSISDTWQSDADFIEQLGKRMLFGLINHFLPAGTRQRSFLIEQGVAANRITVAQMTVDVDAMHQFDATRGTEAAKEFRRKYGVGSDDVVCLFVGRLSEEKGVERLLDDFETMEAGQGAVRLVIVGDGPLLTQIQAKAFHRDTVLMTGRLSGDELWSAFSAADLLVCPSTVEPWGLVVNESMAFGLPVLVNDCCGCADDLVVENETGFIVEKENRGQFVKCLGHLIGDEDERRRLGLNARKLIAGWTISNQAHNIIGAWAKHQG